MKLLAVIPARGGSKGIPRKNLAPVAGKPMLVWTIEHALACHAVAHAFVSTDDEEIADVARRAGAEVPVLRPAELAQDATATEPVLLHAVQTYRQRGFDPDAVMLLQPTSPVRSAGALDRAVEQFAREQTDSLLSVCESHAFFWRKSAPPTASYDYVNRPRRQDIRAEDRWYRENGSIYITRTDVLMRTGNRLGGRIALFEMSEAESYEVDSPTDLLIVDAILSAQCKRTQS